MGAIMAINLNNVREKIKSVLSNYGYTQQEWAEILNVSQPSVSHYLKGRIPPVEILAKIADIARIPIESILFPVVYEENREYSVVKEQNEDYQQTEILTLFYKLPVKAQKQLLSFLRSLAQGA